MSAILLLLCFLLLKGFVRPMVLFYPYKGLSNMKEDKEVFGKP